jgi:hypothetical protein
VLFVYSIMTSLSFDGTGRLLSSVTLLVPQEVVPFQWEFPIRVVPRRTEREAKLRAPVPQKAAQPKSQSHGGASPGGNHKNAKAHAPVPQKAVQPKSQSHGGASPGGNNEKAKHSRGGHGNAS